MLRIGVAPHRLWPAREDETDEVLATARRAEELGFDHVFVSGHAIAGDQGVTPDPLVTLSAVAGATERIGLVTSVLVLPLYNPVVLAHQTATLDRLSRGRFTLGIGTGWDTEEYAAVGVPFAGRGRRADEQLAAVRELWRGEGDVRLGVLPRTEGGPAVWVGGQSDAALRRALRYGEAWHGSGIDAAGLTAVRERLTGLGEQAGRDPRTLALTAGAFLVPPGFAPAVQLPSRPLGGRDASAESVREELAALADAGLSSCSLWLPVAADALPDALVWTAEEILSSFHKVRED
ncbi:TIGR03619 family F420-dependent LLM class oxidoreductase [Streptomyces spinosirectus]|jgi:probable F420-dependent oxidoreductase|uniref:TIGR03619 family F420-dependent LLM class oxidoreductase n=1 Tax=Streptomyces TaxID=1883 RepID=UPI001F457165|nr:MULTISPECIES: TIGR03619 family F420-dependent LLM class oxidoreductase [Streptomyces]UIR21122.1 TIGR03619 family F420-dependent LLM class oxidoreductase [Streptomyces spinosirectus]